MIFAGFVQVILEKSVGTGFCGLSRDPFAYTFLVGLEFLFMVDSSLQLEVLNRIKAEAKKNGCTEKEVIQAYIQIGWLKDKVQQLPNSSDDGHFTENR